MKFSILAPALSLCCIANVHAAACAATRPAPELRRCADEALRAADQRLNRNYATALRALEDDLQAQLRERQREWLAMRDSTCRWEVDAMIASTHPLYPAMYQQCRALLTASRAEGLLEEGRWGYCGDHTSTPELNLCANESYSRADHELNRVYTRLLAQKPESERRRLREAQRRWLSRLEPMCDEKTSGEKGGTIWPSMYAACLAETTRERVRELSGALRE